MTWPRGVSFLDLVHSFLDSIKRVAILIVKDYKKKLICYNYIKIFDTTLKRKGIVTCT